MTEPTSTPSKPPPPAAAARLDKTELAARYGVGTRSIEHWQKDGLPSAKEQRNGRTFTVFDPAAADAWVAANRPSHAESEDRAEAKAQVELEIAREELRRRKAAADALERENAVKAGKLLDAEEVRLGRLARIAEVTRILEPIPATEAPLLAHKSPAECREILAQAIERARREFAREQTA